jgi:hypothetical protein
MLPYSHIPVSEAVPYFAAVSASSSKLTMNLHGFLFAVGFQVLATV